MEQAEMGSELTDEQIQEIPPVVLDEPTDGMDFINNLNDDCLARVFQFLPLLDKFRITAVCKRWRELSKLAWETTKFLKFTHYYGPDWTSQQLPPKSRTREGIERVLKRCGRYLKDLSIDFELDGNILPVISGSCQNLTNLTIAYGDYDHWRVKPFFPKLQCLCMHGRISSDGIVPRELFQALPRDTLKTIFLAIDSSGIKRGFLPQDAPSTLQGFSNLKRIDLEEFILDLDIVRVITQIPTLKSIDLPGCTLRGEFPHFTSFTNLEKLGLGEITQVTDDNLINISETCRELESLQFSSYSVTDRGLRSLKSLTKLERLDISDADDITDAPLSTMHNLAKLICMFCPGVRDDGIITLMKYAPNLETLSLIGTQITNRVLIEANEIVKKRTNNLPLNLGVDDNFINCEIAEKSPLLMCVEYR